MRLSTKVLAVAAAGAFVGPPLMAGVSVAQAPAAPTSVWDGVFTSAQASRGEPIYLGQCSACHGPTPDLPRFAGQPLSETFTFIRTRMPDGSPGSLSPQQYSDVLAYLLGAAGFPAGATELPTASQGMSGITLNFTR